MIKLLGILIAAILISSPMQAIAQDETKPATSVSETQNEKEDIQNQEEIEQKENTEESLEPLAMPKKTSIMTEISIAKEVGKLKSSQIIFKNATDCFKESSFIVDIPDNDPSEAQALINSNSAPCFLRIDISKKPVSTLGSADEKISKIIKFISSISESSKKVKGVLLKSLADSEESSWNENEDELFAYIGMISKGLKKYDSRLLIGGPGFERTFEGNGKYEKISEKLKTFMDYAERLSIPCDFIYINSPNLMPYSYFLEPAFLKSKILPEYKKIGKHGVYFSIGNGIPDEKDALSSRTYAIQNMICLAKAGADFIELPSNIEGRTAKYAIHSMFKEDTVILYDTQGLDRLSFLVQACAPDKDSLYILIGSSSPSRTIIEMTESPLKQKMEEEYRNIVHKFTYGIYSPEYTRYKISLTGCKWQGKTINLKRYAMKRGGFIEQEEESSFNGRSEFYFNKPIDVPSVVLMTLKASEMVQDENNEE